MPLRRQVRDLEDAPLLELCRQLLCAAPHAAEDEVMSTAGIEEDSDKMAGRTCAHGINQEKWLRGSQLT